MLVAILIGMAGPASGGRSQERVRRLIALVLGTLTLGAGAAWAAGFGDATSYPVAPSPDHIASADFDRDGRRDLAVTTCPGADGPVSILLGKRNGEFADSFPEDGHNCGGPIVAGRFDGDRRIDLVVSEQNVGEVAFLKGRRNGRFADAVVSDPELPGGNGLAARDFNRDGILDLAISDYNDSIGISIGDGEGNFATAFSSAAGSKPAGLVATDLTGDGRLDLAVANEAGDTVSVLRGKADAAFDEFDSYPAQGNPYGLAAADFNEDGRRDLVAATRGAGEGFDLLIQKRDHSFKDSVPIGTGGDNLDLRASDLNRDGHMDVVLPNDTAAPNVVSVFRGRGDGTFRNQQDYPVGAFSLGVLVKDFNGDRLPDIATADNGPDVVSVLLNTP